MRTAPCSSSECATSMSRYALITQLAVNTCFETGGNIAPDQHNPQPPVQRNPPQQYIPNYPAFEYEDDMPPVRPNQQGYGRPVPNQTFGQQLNLEFTDEEKAYYKYKQADKSEGIVSSVTSFFSGCMSPLTQSSLPRQETSSSSTPPNPSTRKPS